jgi:molybdopterin converting factor small subunit
MKVLLYGRLAEAVGPRIELAVAASCSVGEVRRRLAADHPDAADTFGRSRVFVAQSFVRDEEIVGDADQIEFLPPVSGG